MFINKYFIKINNPLETEDYFKNITILCYALGVQFSTTY